MAEARKKILFIEGDQEAAALIVDELADQGFEPIAAHDGRSGFDAILEHLPDLVLCDINMPFMSGFEVLERLNAVAPRFARVRFGNVLLCHVGHLQTSHAGGRRSGTARSEAIPLIQENYATDCRRITQRNEYLIVRL